MKEKKVVIIGAGLAGLSAAYELCKHKHIDLHIIEEKSEVGGRVCTKKINGCPVDFGAFIIYPWYKRFNELIVELKCKAQLKKVPLSEIYYDIGDNIGLQNYDAVKLPLSKSIKLFVKIFPEIFVNNKPAQPRLSNFKGLSVKKYFTKKLNLKKNDQYLNMLDTILQGYCYASVDDYKMAFLAATIHQNVLH
jgi:protoporphyrinogen oxidase